MAQTWFGRVISIPRSRYGWILWPGSGFVVRRTAIERLYPHPPHQRLHMPAADLAPLQSQQASQHTRTGEGILQMQPIETLHDLEVR
jgi:hypothetical protein